MGGVKKGRKEKRKKGQEKSKNCWDFLCGSVG